MAMSRRRTASRPARESGQAIIEFAVISIPLFLVFLLTIDAGLFFYGHINAANAVREGARCAAVGGDTEKVAKRVADGFPGAAPTVTVSDRSGIAVGDDVTVSATWFYRWVSPVDVLGFASKLEKTYTVTMRAEGPEQAGKDCG